LPTVSVLANRPIPLCCSLYYYEVTINAKSRSGYASINCAGTVIFYNSNTGRMSVNEDQLPPVGPSFGEGDIVGCGVNFVTNSVFFTKNGLLIGLATVSPQLVSVSLSHPDPPISQHVSHCCLQALSSASG
uniref:B30.2/SPRY domain-containing protein n=1 Tax=Schistocephalus solidus TaxID=70667 RepID=A0A183STM0_SCHSO